MKKINSALKSFIMILVLFQSTKIFAQCVATGTYLNEQFQGGFTFNQNGDNVLPANYTCSGNSGFFTIAVGCNFNSVRGGEIDRVWKNLPPGGLNNSTWTADFRLDINNLGGLISNYPAVHLLIFSANNLALNTNPKVGAGAACGPYGGVANNNSAIWVDLVKTTAPPLCPTPFVGGQANWVFNANTQFTAGTISTSANIPCTGLNTYYIRLQRTWSDWGALFIYSNPGFTNLIGSTCFTINPNIQGLSVEQHATADKGYCTRTFNGRVSNLLVDNQVTCPVTLAPSITMNPIKCCGDQIIANGSTNNSFGGALNHIWTITETDASCNPMACSFTTGWVTGPPNAYNFTNSILNCGHNTSSLVRCGHWYRIDLAVQNCGIGWETTSKCIYVPPLLIADAGTSGTICCQPGFITIGGAPTASGGTPPYTYNWTYNVSGGSGLSSTTVANPTYTWLPAVCGNGTFTVTVTDANGCTATATLSLNGYGTGCRTTTSVKQTEIKLPDEMLIAPNPSDGNFKVSFTSANAIHDVEVVDVLGKIVYRKTEISDPTLVINLSDQLKGVYIVRCKEGDQISIKRVILQ